jgi:hypothetical protein
MYQIINRLGQDTIVSAMTKVRSEDRWRDLTPEECVTLYPTSAHAHHQPVTPATASTMNSDMRFGVEEDGEVWFNWSFLEFWKTNYC